jgi:Sec-independent protein translocase protein TatA
MGFHLFDIVIVVGIGMLIFGPQAFLKWSRSAGKSMKQVNDLKNQVLSELPLNEITEISRNVPRIPTNPLQMAQMLMTSPTDSKKEQPEKAIKAEPKE